MLGWRTVSSDIMGFRGRFGFRWQILQPIPGVTTLQFDEGGFGRWDGRDQYPVRGYAGLRKIPVKATTIQSSEGLAEQYVFITYFDDRFLIQADDKTQISDQDICNFLVALTRAQKEVFLISSDVTKEPTFLKWIDDSRIERVVTTHPHPA